MCFNLTRNFTPDCHSPSNCINVHQCPSRLLGYPCNGLASHPGGVIILQVSSWWVPCDGQASHPGGVVILLVASCYSNWVKFRSCGLPVALVRLYLFYLLHVMHVTGNTLFTGWYTANHEYAAKLIKPENPPPPPPPSTWNSRFAEDHKAWKRMEVNCWHTWDPHECLSQAER